MNKHDRRFSLAAFRRYEPTLTSFLATYPKPYIFRPTSLSRETVINRLRDAARAFIEFNYPSTTLSHEQFSLVWPQVIVTYHDESSVYIGDKHTRPLASLEAQRSKLSSDTPVFLTTNEVILAIATLLNVEVISTPFRLVSTLPSELPDLSPYPNVEVFQDGQDTIIL